MEETSSKILKRYRILAEKFGLDDLAFPLAIMPQDSSYHLSVVDDGYVEISSAGEMTKIWAERGSKKVIEKTFLVDELLFGIFSDYCYSDAWDFELQNRDSRFDSRRIVFSKALESIGKLSPEWKKRMALEQKDILRVSPFKDLNER